MLQTGMFKILQVWWVESLETQLAHTVLQTGVAFLIGMFIILQSYPTSEEIIQIYERIIREMELHLQQLITLPASNPLLAQMRGLLETVIMSATTKDITSAVALIQKVGNSSTAIMFDKVLPTSPIDLKANIQLQSKMLQIHWLWSPQFMGTDMLILDGCHTSPSLQYPRTGSSTP